MIGLARERGMKLFAGVVALLVFGVGTTAAVAMTRGAAGTDSSATLIVRLAAGLSSSDQAAVIARDGGTETGSIAPLRVHLVDVSPNDADAALARYAADRQVVSVERDQTRAAGAIPSDAGYGDQWNLSAVNAVNSALRATYRPDPSLIDLAGNLIAGTASDTTTGSKDSNF